MNKKTYNIYIISGYGINDVQYELYDNDETRNLIIKSDNKYDFKLKMDLIGLSRDSFKIDSYHIFRNLAGGYTASIIISKSDWLSNFFLI